MLAIVLVLSMTACGSSQKKVDEAVDSLTSFDAKQAEIELTYSGKTTSGAADIAGKMVVVNIGDNNFAMEVKYKMDNSEYETVTTLFVTDSAVYINATQAMDFIGKLYPSYSVIKSYIKLSSDYVMLTKEEIATYLTAYGVDASSLNLTNTSTSKTSLKETAKVMFDILQQASDKSKTSFMTAEDGGLKFKIKAADCEKILDAFADIDIAASYSKSGNEEFEKNKDQYVQSYKDSVTKLKDQLKSSGVKIDMDATAKAESGNKAVTIKSNTKITTSSDEESKLGLNITYSQDASASYTLPSKSASLAEVMAILQKLGVTK